MNFISLIKRPLSLVLNDSSTMAESNASSPTKSQSAASPTITSTTVVTATSIATDPTVSTPTISTTGGERTAVTSRQQQSPSTSVFIAAMNTSIAANIAEAFGAGGDCNITPQTIIATTPKNFNIQRLNSNCDSNLNTSNTIEELLIQINDNLSQADLNAEQPVNPPFVRKYTPPVSPLPPISIHESGIVSAKPLPIIAKSPLSHPVSSTNISTSNDCKLGNFSNFTQTDLYIDKSITNNLQEFEEGTMLELPANLSTTIDETMNRCGLPLNNNDGDTGVSSDNELFVECQSYQNTPMKLTHDVTTEVSEIETYRSAVNIDENNIGTDIEEQLNATLSGIPDLNDDIMALPNSLERSSYKIDNTPLTTVAQQTLQNHMDNSFDEPMDVDMSCAEDDNQNGYKKDANNKTIDEKNKFEQKIISEACTSPQVINNLNIENNCTPSTFHNQEEFNKDSLQRLSPKEMEKTLNTDEIASKCNLSVNGRETEEPSSNTSEHHSLNAAVETHMNTNNNNKEIPVLLSNNTFNLAKTKTIDSCLSETEDKQLTNEDNNNYFNYDNVLNKSFEKQAKDNQDACNRISNINLNIKTDNECNMSSECNWSSSNDANTSSTLDHAENLNVTIEMKSPSISRKCSDALQAPSFPTKIIGDEKQFPRSPNKDDKNRQMRFLEKSEYAEKLNKQLAAMQKPIVDCVEVGVISSNCKTNTDINNKNEATNIVSTNDERNNIKMYSPLNVQSNLSMSKSTGTTEYGSGLLLDNISNEIGESPNKLNATFNGPAISTPNPSKSLNDKTSRRTFTLSSPIVLNRTLNGELESEENIATSTSNRTINIENLSSHVPQTSENNTTFNSTTSQKEVPSCGLQTNPLTVEHIAEGAAGGFLNETVEMTDASDDINKRFDMKNMNMNIPSTMSPTNSLNILASPFKSSATSPSTQSPTIPSMHDDKVFKMPLTTRTQLIPIAQKRKSIHPSNSDKESPIDVDIEFLSAKEQTKCKNRDEKDNSHSATPSPLDEMLVSSTVFTNFESATMTSSDDQFSDSDFKSTNLILNELDFDYLLTKGNNNAQGENRSSVLLKFDPLFGAPVFANNSNLQQQLLTTNNINNNNNNNNNTFGFNAIAEKSDKKNSTERSCVVQGAKSLLKGRKDKDSTQSFLPARKKKNVKMSVDVIDNNDCNKTFDPTNSSTDDKQNNYKMDELEKKIKNEVLKTEDVEKKLKEAELKEEALIKRITEKDKTISKMNGVIEAYEKAIAELIAEKEQLIQNYEKQLSEIKADRDSNYHHLTSLETTFSDLHVKYEKSKEMTLQLKANEEVLIAENKQNMENSRLQGQRYEKMKNHAMQQLEIANKKLELLSKEHAIETTKLKALLKKEEISRASTNEQLQQKTRENAELVKICDELINGQGS